MNNLSFTLLVWLGSCMGGYLGALTGLGGGVVIIPLLALVFHVDMHYAIGASLISVIATSSGAASAYVKEGYSNIRIGMFLEVATTIGALVGAYLALKLLNVEAIAVIFGVVLLFSAAMSWHGPPADPPDGRPPDRLASFFKLEGTFPTPHGPVGYRASHVPLGFGLMVLAGVLSGLLGIGSGAMKVLAMDRAMRIPFKVSTTTSNFMIGVTAATSAGIYLAHGYIDPVLTVPVMLGVLTGAFLGTLTLVRARTTVLRRVFVVVVVLLALQMIWKGVAGE